MEMNNQAEILRRFSQRRPHVALAWDDTAKKVVAPPTQVGMSWNQACSSLVHSSSGLVDSFDVPKELFELSNLENVLTMEAWESCLSQSEKELVSIYLPEGVDQDIAVQAVLNGENLHFGNSLHTWGASVCSGAMHPDELVKREAALSKSRKAQRKHLRSYHEKMTRKLQTMKDIWSECRGTMEVLPRIRRWLRSSQRESISPSRNGCITPKRPSETAEARTKHGRSEERHEDSKTTRKEKNKETHNRQSAKRLKTGVVGDGSVDNGVHQSNFESDFFKKYVEVSLGALTRDQLSDITVPVKVTRKQFENLKSRRQAGEEVHFDSLDTEEDHGSSAECHVKKNQMDAKEVEALKLYWRDQVVKSLPGAHIKFTERKTSLLRLADSIARSCMEERVYFIQETEEPCSPDRVAPQSEEDRIPTDAAGSGVEDDTLSQNWRGKHLLAEAVSEDAEEFSAHSREEEPMDLASASEEEDTNSSDEKEGRRLDLPSRSGEKISSNECSPVSKVEDDIIAEEGDISFTPQGPLKDVQPEESFESEANILPSVRLHGEEGERLCADKLSGYEIKQPSAGDSVLISGHHTFSAKAPEPNFSVQEKQELQLLPIVRHTEVPNLHHLGSVPQSVQEPPQLFAEHTHTHFENPISSLISFSKRQHQLSGPPPSLPQHPYPTYSLPSSAPLPMAVPVVELAPMWPSALHRPSPAPAMAQFGGGQNGSWPVPDGTSAAGGWGLSEALQSASRRAQLQVSPPGPAAPVHRWDMQNRNVYPTDQTMSKPERVFDQQQFYTDWSSRGEFPAAPSHSESAAPYRAPSWYPTGPYDNVSNPLSGNPMQQHLPLQRHPLWPTDSAPPKPLPQLWGNVNWRPS